MKKSERIHELEVKMDNLIDYERTARTDLEVSSAMITKEIIMAQLNALQLNFDEDADVLIKFLLHLNEKGLINNHDFSYVDEAFEFLGINPDSK